MSAPPYKRIILKLSGESFVPPGQRGISMQEVVDIAGQTYRAAQLGVEIGIVIGGGNILRGAQFTAGNSSIQEATAHYMGMLATVINGLALQDALESLGCATRLMSAVRMDGVFPLTSFILWCSRRPGCLIIRARPQQGHIVNGLGGEHLRLTRQVRGFRQHLQRVFGIVEACAVFRGDEVPHEL